MNKLYRKSEIGFALAWIGVYVVLTSLADNLSEAIGLSKSVTLAVHLALAAILLAWIRKNGLSNKYGLCPPQVPAARLLYYLPLAVIATSGLWLGLAHDLSPLEAVLTALSMLCVGFLEEVIFRGLLFRAMAKNNLKSAIIVSSVTFGIGHIVNLFNGSGRSPEEAALQIIFAVMVGFVLVMVYCRCGSLIPCILFHGLNNVCASLGADAASSRAELLVYLLIIAVGVGYLLYLIFALPRRDLPE